MMRGRRLIGSVGTGSMATHHTCVSATWRLHIHYKGAWHPGLGAGDDQIGLYLVQKGEMWLGSILHITTDPAGRYDNLCNPK